MTIMRRLGTSRMALAAILGVVLLFTLAACSDDGDSPDDGSPTAIPTKVPSPSEVRLTADGCAADCAFSLDQSFTLALEVIDPPAPGYIALQSLIDFGDLLTYDAEQREAQEEIVWADCADGVALRDQGFGPTLVSHGCLTGLIPPLPVSNATGTFVEFTLTCSADPSTTAVRIVPDGDPVAVTSGTTFMEADEVTRSAPSGSDLTINCG